MFQGFFDVQKTVCPFFYPLLVFIAAKRRFDGEDYLANIFS